MQISEVSLYSLRVLQLPDGELRESAIIILSLGHSPDAEIFHGQTPLALMIAVVEDHSKGSRAVLTLI